MRISHNNTSFWIRRLQPRFTFVALGLIILAAAVLRLSLANYSLWFDEYASLFFAHQPLSRLWSTWLVRETNPPLYYSVLRGWMLLVGPMDREMLRVPSIIASLLTIIVLSAGIWRAFGKSSAVVGAAMLAVSAQQISYAHQVRGYSFFGLSIAISFVGLVWIITADERKAEQSAWAWFAHIVGSVAAVYCHTTGFLWIPIASACLIAVDRDFVPFLGRYWLRLALADTAIIAGSFWALFIVYSQIQHPNPNISWLDHLGLEDTARLFWESTLLAKAPYARQAFSAVAVLGFALGAVLLYWKNVSVRFAALCWVLAIIVFIAFSVKQPVLIERTIVWFAMFPAFLAAGSLHSVRAPYRFYAGSSLLVVLLLANLIKTHRDFMKEDWDTAVRTVAHDPGSVLLVRGEGHAIVAEEACKLVELRSACSFPIVALNGDLNNAWARGYSKTPPTLADGTLRISNPSHLYIIVRHQESPLRDVKTAGLLSRVPIVDRFLLGPYDHSLLVELVRSGCVHGKLFYAVCDKDGRARSAS